MAEHQLPIPQQCTAVALLTDNAGRQLHALAQAYSRADLLGEIPRLTTTAISAATLARDMLDGLLKQLKPPKAKRAPHARATPKKPPAIPGHAEATAKGEP